MCKKKKCNIQLSGLSLERSVEHLRQNRTHSWILWNCTNNMHKYVFKTKKKDKMKSKVATGRAECTHTERLVPIYCSATAHCSPVQSVVFRLVSDCPLVYPSVLGH